MQQCPYFKKCGGCQYALDDYQASVAKKKATMEELFHLKDAKVVTCANLYHYRHKVIFSFYKNKDQKILAGLYQEESHHIIAIELHCIQNVPVLDFIKDIQRLCAVRPNDRNCPFFSGVNANVNSFQLLFLL